MPRGVRKSPQSIADQVSEIDVKIKSHQSKIKNLSEKKKSLLSSKEKVEMDTLYQYVKESGKTPAELIAQLPK